LRSDADLDPDDRGKGPNDDEQGMVAAGHGASLADRRAIATIVRTYYAAAKAGDGAKACSLLDATLVTAITEEAGKLAPSDARTCVTSVSRLFKQQHQYLVAEDPGTMVITGVHVKDAAGVATLGFKTMPEGEILLQREGRAWKINALFDHQLP
jgi:hypothetical protein